MIIPNYRQWRDTWQPMRMASPLDLVTGEHPNNLSVGIELQAPEHPGPDVFTDAQYQALGELVADIGQRQSIRLDRGHLLGHYDCCPMRRSNSRGSTDPGLNFNWNRLFDSLPKALS